MNSMRAGFALRFGAVAASVGVAIGVVVIGGVLGNHDQPSLAGASQTDTTASMTDRLTRFIQQSQERLRRVPGDWASWAALSIAYLDKASRTGDPTYYPKAEQAAQRSLLIRPRDNVAALVAQGALANARHDFATGRDRARAAIVLDRYHADAYAVLTDAETQLGHPRAATAAVQHLLDLRPGLPAYARAAYDLEQRGQPQAAAELLSKALNSTVDRTEIAYCRTQLGDLALRRGYLAEADSHYRAAVAADPTAVAARRGQALVAAAFGDLDRALSGYAELTRRSPTPANLIEYAQLLSRAGQPDQARAQLELAAAAHHLFIVNGGVDGLTGAALAQAAGRPDEALRQASAEWRRRHHLDVADALAWALHNVGRDREALAYARRLAANPRWHTDYAFHLGMIEAALGHRDRAETPLRLALLSPLYGPQARAALATIRPAPPTGPQP